jgi:hypothetical protein
MPARSVRTRSFGNPRLIKDDERAFYIISHLNFLRYFIPASVAGKPPTFLQPSLLANRKSLYHRGDPRKL